MKKSNYWMILIIAIITFALSSCSPEDEEKATTATFATGSCNYSAIPLGNSGLTAQICLDYIATAEQSAGSIKAQCTTLDPNIQITGEWSDSECDTTGRTATCEYSYSEGGNGRVTVYDTTYNFLVDASSYDSGGGFCQDGATYTEY